METQEICAEAKREEMREYLDLEKLYKIRGHRRMNKTTVVISIAVIER